MTKGSATAMDKGQSNEITDAGRTEITHVTTVRSRHPVILKNHHNEEPKHDFATEECTIK